MVEEKLDWFPLYWQKFIIGTFEMESDEVGAYMRLLIYEWDKGFIPNNDKDLVKISRVSMKKLENVLKKFKETEGKLYNDTLEIIRIEQVEKFEKNSNRGKNGAKVRWENYRLGKEQAMLEHNESNSIRVDKTRIEKNIKVRVSEIVISEDSPVELKVLKNFWKLFAKERLQDGKLKNKTLINATEDKWKKDLDALTGIDKRTLDEIREAYDFIKSQKSKFWITTIESMAGLRKNFDKIMDSKRREINSDVLKKNEKDKEHPNIMPPSQKNNVMPGTIKINNG